MERLGRGDPNQPLVFERILWQRCGGEMSGVENSGREANWLSNPAMVRARDTKERALRKWTNGG